MHSLKTTMDFISGTSALCLSSLSAPLRDKFLHSYITFHSFAGSPDLALIGFGWTKTSLIQIGTSVWSTVWCLHMLWKCLAKFFPPLISGPSLLLFFLQLPWCHLSRLFCPVPSTLTDQLLTAHYCPCSCSYHAYFSDSRFWSFHLQDGHDLGQLS